MDLEVAMLSGVASFPKDKGLCSPHMEVAALIAMYVPLCVGRGHESRREAMRKEGANEEVRSQNTWGMKEKEGRRVQGAGKWGRV